MCRGRSVCHQRALPEKYGPSRKPVLFWHGGFHTLKFPIQEAALLDVQVRSLSQYLHGDVVVLSRLESDLKTSDHVLRCAKALSQVGCVVAACTQNALKIPFEESALQKIELELQTMLASLYQDRIKKRGT